MNRCAKRLIHHHNLPNFVDSSSRRRLGSTASIALFISLAKTSPTVSVFPSKEFRPSCKSKNGITLFRPFAKILFAVPAPRASLNPFRMKGAGNFVMMPFSPTGASSAVSNTSSSASMIPCGSARRISSKVGI